MTTKTKISWTQTTWNPVVGCSHVSEGCRNCYAERMDKRIRAARGQEYRAWTAQNAAYNIRLYPERLEQPRRWREPRMVFVNSMSDLFHENVPDDFIARVWQTMQDTPKHTYQILTKRPQRMRRWVSSWFGVDTMPPASNVWLGVSVEDQKNADERIPLLLQTPAAVRFLSCEPLLGPIDLWQYLGGAREPIGERWNTERRGIDWVIGGGESGPHFRPMNLDWARSIRDQCVGAGVIFFFKQESAYHSETNPMLDGVEWHQYPGDTQVRPLFSSL